MSWKNGLILFLKKGHQKQLRVGLRERWLDIYPEEKGDIYRFLFLNRQDKLFVYLFAIDLQNRIQGLPWILFLKLIRINQLDIPRDCFDEIVFHFKKQKIIAGNVTSVSGMMEALMEEEYRDFLNQISAYEKELLTSIRIAESERLEDQKTFYINELKKIDPFHFNTSKVVGEKEKNQAERVMQKLKMKKRKMSFKTGRFNEGSEERGLIEAIKSQARSYHNRGRARAVDFAYLLRSLGESELSVDFVYNEKDSPQRDWQLLDYLFFGGQYVSALHHCEFLKRKYAHDPNALFPVYYAEAIAFWELGEKEKALDLMSQISSMRPYFKSATKILSQWKEELFE